MAQELIYYLDNFEEVFFRDMQQRCVYRPNKKDNILVLLEDTNSINVMQHEKDYFLEEEGGITAHFSLAGNKVIIVGYKEDKVYAMEKCQYDMAGQRQNAILYKVTPPNEVY